MGGVGLDKQLCELTEVEVFESSSPLSESAVKVSMRSGL